MLPQVELPVLIPMGLMMALPSSDSDFRSAINLARLLHLVHPFPWFSYKLYVGFQVKMPLIWILNHIHKLVMEFNILSKHWNSKSNQFLFEL